MRAKLYIKSFSLALFSIITFFLTTQISSAVVIDFESLYENNNSTNNQGDSYSEDGFTLTKPDDFYNFMSFGDLSPKFVGSTSLFNNTVGTTTTLTKDDGGFFSIFSIDLNELNFDRVVTVNFTGTTSGGGTVNQSFTLDGIKSTVETFFFNALFTDLTQLSWVQESPYHQFDNIVLDVAAVPVPAALPMMASGLLAFGFVAYRRRKQSA